MSLPPPVPFSGRDKWSEIAFNLALAAGGSALVALVVPQLAPGVTALWALVAYTGYAVVVTLALVIVQVGTSRLPTMERATLDGEPALRVRSWRAPWWHAVSLDLGLGILGAALLVLGLSTGGDLAVVGLLFGLVGLWFLGRVGLVVLGRRFPPTLWLTADELVLDLPSGRARGRRASVARVHARGRRLVVRLEGPSRWSPTPWPWRGRGATPPDALVLDCSETGHRAADLAAWLEDSWRTSVPDELVVSDPA